MNWISVKVKKPPLRKNILVSDGKEWTVTNLFDELIPIRVRMDSVGFRGSGFEFNFEYEDITYWMPGPELPK